MPVQVKSRVVVGWYWNEEVALTKLDSFTEGDMNIDNLVVPIQHDVVACKSLFWIYLA